MVTGLQLRWVTEPAADRELVIATGVFDLLHVGQARFLAAARRAGGSLAVGVEDDVRARARKGPGRPLVPAEERCELLAALRAVDGVFLISGPTGLWAAEAYAELLRPLRPAAVAFTAGDPAEEGKRRAAASLGASVLVVPAVPARSTSLLAERLGALG